MNSRRFGLIVIVLSVVMLFMVLGMRESMQQAQAERAMLVDAPPAVTESMPIINAVTDFALINTNGAEFGLADLKGKIWVADLMFTSCAGTCPTLTQNMKSVQQAYLGDATVNFVSISVDPETDTPDQMGAYATKMGADQSTWHFLTGPSETVQSLAVDGFKVGSADEPVFHSNRFVLIDPNGHVRGYFMGTESEDMPRLIEAIGRLQAEFGL